MGYGYGLWYILDNNTITTLSGHIPHVTLKCNMSYEDATKLYRELVYKGLRDIIFHMCREPITFSKMYSNDLFAGWGYYVIMKPMVYLQCQLYSEKYKGDFSELPHMTMQYNGLNMQPYMGRTHLNGKLVIADIRDDDPKKWVCWTR